jgi:hypothetical protein
VNVSPGEQPRWCVLNGTSSHTENIGMPTTIKFGKLFDKSPFKPVRKHMSLATECTAFMPALVQAFLAGNRQTLEDVRQGIDKQEAVADQGRIRDHQVD